MARNINEINLKGVILVLAHGNMAHLKKRENMRIMRAFAVKGIRNLESEKDHIEKDDLLEEEKDADAKKRPYKTFEMLCVKYYEFALKYCLNK